MSTILTFYSYKGGTGRSMALANVAWILASNGARVLIIDWDLEAPGLHRYFAPLLGDPKLEDSEGLIDFLFTYQVAASRPQPDGVASAEDWYLDYADLLPYAQPVRVDFPDGGSVDLVGAGLQQASYAERVNTFDWKRFYNRYGGRTFLDAVFARLREEHDYVLIDSRTGVSDTAGICTVQLPDVLVVFSTLNNQGIEGATAVAKDAKRQREGTAVPLRVFPVASRVDDGEIDKLNSRRKLFRGRFAELLSMSEASAAEYFGEIELPYKRFYSYEEQLATLVDNIDTRSDLLWGYVRLVHYLTDGVIGGLPAQTDTLRQELRARYDVLAEVSPAPKTPDSVRRYDVFLSYTSTDVAVARELATTLRSHARVFFSEEDVRFGDDIVISIGEAMARSRVIAVLLTPRSLTSMWVRREVTDALAICARSGASLIPILYGVGPHELEGPFAELARLRSLRFEQEIEAPRVAEGILQALGHSSIGGHRTKGSIHAQSLYEGPGGVPITAVPDFTGRTEELERLEQALVQHQTVCVVATGIGGIGKTWLTRQFVFARGSECFPDGSAWLDATRLTQDLDRVCRRFGWSEPGELRPEESVAWLARHLHDRRFLLVVDNVGPHLDREHVPRPGGRCRTLVTTRERALHDDLDAERLELGAWSEAESLVFLRARSKPLRNVADPELVPLLEFVGRLPLGVKLLESLLVRRPSLTPAEALLSLRAQPVEVLEKYRGQNLGLVATFQSTWDGLEEQGRRVLQALAVCARQTGEPVVGSVAGVEDVDKVLDNLHGRSLVEHDGVVKTPWRLHDVVRMFVAAQAGREAFEAAHLAWVEAHVKAHANVLDHVAFEEGVDEAVVAVHRLAAAKEFERAMALYHPVESHSRRLGAYPRAMEFGKVMLDTLPGETGWASECMNNLGGCYQVLGDIPKAIDFHQRSLAIDEKLGRLEGQASALGNLGGCYQVLGDIPKAIDFHQRSLAIDEKLGRLEGQANQLGNLGLCYQVLGDIPKAIDFLQRSLAIDEKLGRLEGQASALGHLGGCYQVLGDIPKAIDFHQRSLAIDEKLGRLEGQASDLCNLGGCYQVLGDIPKAIDFLQCSLAIDEKLGRLEGQASNLGNLGLCYRVLGDIPKAIDFLQHSLAIDEKLGRLEGQANQLCNLGGCYVVLGDIPKAIDFHQRSLAIDEKLGRLEGQASDLGNLGLCYRVLGDIPKAIDFLQRSLAIDEKLGRLVGQANQLANLGFIAEEQGDVSEARHFLTRAEALFRQMGLPDDHPNLSLVRSRPALLMQTVNRLVPIIAPSDSAD